MTGRSPARKNAALPQQLGSPDGPEIANKTTVLRDLDNFLNRGRPPAVEFIHMENYVHAGSLPVPNLNAFGHAALRYRVPRARTSGHEREDRVVDFENLGGGKLGIYTFPRSEDFFYGTAGYGRHNANHGAYDRNMVSCRVEDLDEASLENLDDYLSEVQELARRGEIRFGWVGRERKSIRVTTPWQQVCGVLVREQERGRRQSGGGSPPEATVIELTGVCAKEIPCSGSPNPAPGRPSLVVSRSGNCAQWVTRALAHAGVLARPRVFPKKPLVDLIRRGRNCLLPQGTDIHVVYYRRIGHAAHGYTGDPLNVGIGSLAGLFNWRRNLRFLRLKSFADVAVVVERGSDVALLKTNSRLRHQRRVSRWKFVRLLCRLACRWRTRSSRRAELLMRSN